MNHHSPKLLLLALVSCAGTARTDCWGPTTGLGCVGVAEYDARLSGATKLA